MTDHADNSTVAAAGDEHASARRRLLSVLAAGGLAAVVSPLVGARAQAASDGSPDHRDPADDARLNAAIERETRMVATCKAAVSATPDGDFHDAFLLIHDHHLAYAQAIKGYLGTSAVAPRNVSALAPIAGRAEAIAAVLAGLEDETVAIHLGILAELKGVDAAALVASIITVEARHAAALAYVSGSSVIAATGN